MIVQGTNGSNRTEYCAILIDKERCDAAHWTHVGVGVLSVLACFYIIVLLLCLKKRELCSCRPGGRTERLIIYLAFAVLLNTIHYISADYHIATHAKRSGNTGVCIFQGWYYLFTAWMANFWVCIIALNICYLVKYLKELPASWKCDMILWLVNALVSLAISVIPFFVDAYGPAGIWCWIPSTKDGKDFHTGIVLQFVLYYGLWIALCILIAIALIWAFIVTHKRGENTHQEETSADKKKIKTLMPLPLIYMVAFLVATVCRITYDVHNQDHVPGLHWLWLVVSIVMPLPGAIFAVVITINYRKDVMAGRCCAGGSELESKPLRSKADDRSEHNYS